MNKITIYCDGACHPNNSKGIGGYGAVILSGQSREEISGSAAPSTNNRMELTAAIKALQNIQEPSEILIKTDSQYLINAFNKNWLKGWQKNNWITSQKKPVLNKDLWILLLEQNNKHKIKWEWVRGHNGDKENERCDELAVKARIMHKTNV